MTDVELEKKAKLYADEHYNDTDEYGYWFSDIEMLRRAYIAGAKETQKETIEIEKVSDYRWEENQQLKQENEQLKTKLENIDREIRLISNKCYAVEDIENIVSDLNDLLVELEEWQKN